MNYITSTQLRSQVPRLIKTLSKGEKINLIHRSRIVGQIIPSLTTSPQRKFNPRIFLESIKSLNLKKLSSAEVKKRYQQALQKRYENFSRH